MPLATTVRLNLAGNTGAYLDAHPLRMENLSEPSTMVIPLPALMSLSKAVCLGSPGRHKGGEEDQ